MTQDAIDSLHEILNINMVICSWNNARIYLSDVISEIQTLPEDEFHIDLEIPSEIYGQIILHGNIIEEDGEVIYRTAEIEFIRKNNKDQSFRIPYVHELNDI